MIYNFAQEAASICTLCMPSAALGLSCSLATIGRVLNKTILLFLLLIPCHYHNYSRADQEGEQQY